MTMHSRNVSVHVAIERGDAADAEKVFGDVVDIINAIDMVYASCGKVTVRVATPMKT